jgi:hypothetical protein
MSNTASPSPPQPAEPGRLTDRRTTPLGVMPRHLQTWVLLGTAVVMVGIMGLPGSPTKPRTGAAPSPATSAVDANQQRIEEYQRRIQEQAQRLAAEQAQLQLTKDAVAAAPDGTVGPVPRRSSADAPAAAASATAASRALRVWRRRWSLPALMRIRSSNICDGASILCSCRGRS